MLFKNFVCPLVWGQAFSIPFRSGGIWSCQPQSRLNLKNKSFFPLFMSHWDQKCSRKFFLLPNKAKKNSRILRWSEKDFLWRVRCEEDILMMVVLIVWKSLFKKAFGQWLWLSWQSSRFRHQGSEVRIPSLAKFILNCSLPTVLKRRK